MPLTLRSVSPQIPSGSLGVFGNSGAAQARTMQQPPQPPVQPLNSSQPSLRAQVPQFLSPQVRPVPQTEAQAGVGTGTWWGLVLPPRLCFTVTAELILIKRRLSICHLQSHLNPSSSKHSLLPQDVLSLLPGRLSHPSPTEAPALGLAWESCSVTLTEVPGYQGSKGKGGQHCCEGH